MSIGQFMPFSCSSGRGYEPDPYSEYVLLDLRLDGEDQSKSVIDTSPYRYPIDVYGNAKIDASQRIFTKTSLFCDGVNSHIIRAKTNDLNQPADLTIELWFRMSVVREATIFSCKAGAGNWPPLVWVASNGSLILHVVSNTTRIQSAAGAVKKDTWHYLTVQRRGWDWSMYLDGQRVGVWYHNSSDQAWGDWYFNLGRQSHGSASYFPGNFAHFRWWKGVATRGVATSFELPKKPWEPPHKGLFTPTYITCGTLRSGWFGYNKTVDQYYAVTGSINAQPFEGLSVLRIHGYYGGPYDGYNGMLELEGTFTVEEAARINRLVPPLRLRRNTVTLNLPPFTRDANGQLSAFGNVQGDLNLFVAGSVVFLESQNAPVSP